MVISLESTEKFSSNTLVNLEMEMKVRAVKVARAVKVEIQDQMKEVEKRNKERNQKTSKQRLTMRKK